MSTKNIIRAFLVLLILLNVWMIFALSSESAELSGETSGRVTTFVAQIVVKDFKEKTPVEQAEIIERLHPYVRSAAHMTEFGLLGAWVMLLLLTYHVRPLFSGLVSVLGTFLMAVTDEAYQHFSGQGRAAELKDVLLDTSGAIITCTILFAMIALLKQYQKKKRMAPMKVTTYHVPCQKLSSPLRIAIASDLHDNPYERVIEAIKKESPDLILIPGDLTDDERINTGAPNALAFLRTCVALAPTYYSLGNHEIRCYHKGNHFSHPTPVPIPDHYRAAVAETGAVLLEDCAVQRNNLLLCALGSGLNGKINEPNTNAVNAFRTLPSDHIKILLCHHPEYIPEVSRIGMDLIVCGHAHGGQWRIFGRGVFAPGQGIFPKYTSGIHNGNCVISRGLGDHTSIPRIFNDNELVIVELG